MRRDVLPLRCIVVLIPGRAVAELSYRVPQREANHACERFRKNRPLLEAFTVFVPQPARAGAWKAHRQYGYHARPPQHPLDLATADFGSARVSRAARDCLLVSH